MILEQHDAAGRAGRFGGRGRRLPVPACLACAGLAVLLSCLLSPRLQASILPDSSSGLSRFRGIPASSGAIQVSDTLPDDDSLVDPTAFLDSTALGVFSAARRRQMEADSTIRSYEAIRRQRFSVELRTPLRDRTLYHAEAASRVWWSRDGVVEQYLASRETSPEGVEPPGGLVDISEIFDPAASPFSRSGAGRSEEGEGDDDAPDLSVSVVAEDFLAPGSEEHYRFRTADTLTLGLPDGRTLRTIALEVLPRERSGRLGSGMIWIEPETGALVRSVSRLSEAFDFEDEGIFDDVREMRLVPGIFRPIQFDVSLVVVEYSLWDFRYWMRRRVRVEGAVRAGALTVPGVLEETYQVLDVEGERAEDRGPDGADARGGVDSDLRADARDRVPAGSDTLSRAESPEQVAERWSGDGRYGDYRIVRRNASEDGEEGGDGPGDVEAGDDVEAGEDADPEEDDGGEDEDAGDTDEENDSDRPLRIVLAPVDSSRLHDPEWLPPPVWEEAPGFTSAEARDELEDLLGDLQIPPPASRGVRFDWGYEGADLLRYNRVEGFSVGARARWEPPVSTGPDELTATARLGMGTWVPSGRIEAAWTGSGSTLSLEGYHAVTPVDPAARSLGLGNSATALFFGRDDGDYFRATGARIALTPGELDRSWYEIFASVEEHRPLPARAGFSVFGGSDPFRPALEADRVREYRVGARIAPSWGSSLFGAHGGVELGVERAEGDRSWTRGGATGWLGIPLFAGLRAGVEVAGGHLWGDPPVQRSWFLGGTRTLRGYEGAAAVGRTYGRARADLSWGTPAGRISAFGDAGWAGDADLHDPDDILLSAGAGLSFLEGLFRVDLARALRAPTGWSLQVHLDSFH